LNVRVANVGLDWHFG